MTDVEAALVAEVLADLPGGHGPVLALAVADPGLWHFPQASKGVGCLGLCDAARLAEATGLSVIDDFPARDLAAGGQGGPVTAVAEWLLLRDPVYPRMLLSLGQSVRATYLPAATAINGAERVMSFQVGPGMGLLDLLAQKLTGGRHAFDPGGRLAVQGRKIPQLLAHWLQDPYFKTPLPRWHPRGVPPERFLADSMEMALRSDWSVQDLLCTATHFVAETIAMAVRRRFDDEASVQRVLVTGGGQHNGMLLREIGTRLPGVSVARIGESGIPSAALGPATVAVLAMLFVNQTPANSTAISGTEVARVLGRLTPGSPLSWRQLLQCLAGRRAAPRTLRSSL